MKCRQLAGSLVTADWHLTAAQHGEYRWAIFDKLAQVARRTGSDRIYLLGDLTDAKDHHSAEFVRRVWKGVRELSEVASLYILKGNHDYRTGPAFFEWLGELPRVTYVAGVCRIGHILFLPHTRTPADDWGGINVSDYPCILMHETAHGAIVSNGMRVPGPISGEAFVQLGASVVLSGDVHVPQRVGAIDYVGSPYHVHFGDRFRPRIMAFDQHGVSSDIRLDFPERFVATISAVEDLRGLCSPGDMLKVRIRADAAAIDFRSMRESILAWAAQEGVLVQGVEIAKRKERKRPVTEQPSDAGDVVSGREMRGRGEPEALLRAYGEDVGADAETIRFGLDILRGLG